jgi:Dihydroorotase and related cyclic amidohydrolases
LAEKFLVGGDLSLLGGYFCGYPLSQISSGRPIGVISLAAWGGEVFTTGVSVHILSLDGRGIGDFSPFLLLSPPLRTGGD